MARVSEQDMILAKHAAAAFGSKPSVQRYWDDNDKSFVDILSCSNSPEEGVTSFSTVGLSSHTLLRDGKEYPARIELVGACGSSFSSFPNILATAAFCVINSRWFCYPTAIFPNVVATYAESETMPHLFFTTPFLWDEKLQTQELSGKNVAWLQIIPISDAERCFADENGADSLEDLFVEKQIDIFDLNRPSVV